MAKWTSRIHQKLDNPAPPQIIDIYETDLIRIKVTQTELSMISFYDEISRQAVASCLNSDFNHHLHKEV